MNLSHGVSCRCESFQISVLENVEDRAVRVDPADGVVNAVVGLVALGRCDALEDSRGRTWPVAAHREDTGFAVRELNPQDSSAVGPLAGITDVVGKRRR